MRENNSTCNIMIVRIPKEKSPPSYEVDGCGPILLLGKIEEGINTPLDEMGMIVLGYDDMGGVTPSPIISKVGE
jgi:hypothetical protein